MVVRGKVKRGKVVLADPNAIPDGTDVEVRPVKTVRKPAGKKGTTGPSAGRRPKRSRPTTKPGKASKPEKLKRGWLFEALRPHIGSVKDLPPDMSVNLDHYLYGHPKQK